MNRKWRNKGKECKGPSHAFSGEENVILDHLGTGTFDSLHQKHLW